MAESDEGFLSRWARRKAEEGEAPDEPAAEDAASTAPDAEAGAEEGDGKTAAEREAEVVAALPDIDSLDETSDFAQFMQSGVPAALQRQALRKLWRVNPVFSFLDGMAEYDEDYTLATSALTEVKTIYQVGKGMVLPEEEAAEEEAAADELAEAEGVGSETATGEPPEAAVDDGDRAAESVETGETDDVLAAESETTVLPDLPSTPEAALSGAGPSGSDVPEAAPVGSGRSAAQRRWGAFDV